jgi:hypothetical protein
MAFANEKGSKVLNKLRGEVEVEERILESEETQLLPVLKALSSDGVNVCASDSYESMGFKKSKLQDALEIVVLTVKVCLKLTH